MKSKKLKIKKPKKPFILKLKNIAIICLMCYAVIVLVSQQIVLSQKKDEIKKLQNKVEISQQQNDEYHRILNMSDSDEYIKRIAIEKLGYAYPGEIRVYDTSKN